MAKKKDITENQEVVAQVAPKSDMRFGQVNARGITEEMEQSYLDYAMSVIVSRALPDVRDGMKPVHRRILFAMHELGMGPSSKYKKSARLVGDVLGKYHPHGDTAVYDSMVRMAQPFSLRYPLVDGQGNYGSVDGDSAAAMRYTEARMSKIAPELLVDLDKETVDFRPNYDGSEQEPSVLPARLPNLLLNGTEGIAVGMATKIPPHNLGELVDAIVAVIDNPEVPVEDLTQFVPGPDFPTGASIYNSEELKLAYTAGRGKVVMRAEAKIEEGKKGSDFQIIVTELPYQVNKANLVEKIADLVKEKKIIGISDLRDESDRDGIRIVVELKRDAYPQKVLNSLFKMTQMQETFHINMLALVDGIQPRVLNLKEVIEYYILHRKDIVVRRTEFDLKKARERLHILEGLKIALDNLDAVIKTIRESKTKEEAKENLVKKFKLTEIQAQAILDMRLAALAALERKRIEDEYKEKLTIVKDLEDILAKPKRVLSIIKDETTELKEKFGDKRRTRIHKKQIGQFKEEDLIPNEEVIITLSENNYIKRMPVNVYRTQGRGGKGVIGATVKEEDAIAHVISAMNHDYILFFTDKGRVFQARVFEIVAGSRISKGQAIVNLIQLSSDEKVTGIITLKDFQSKGYFFMITRNGTVKKTAVKDYHNVRKSGLIAIKLDAGDKLDRIKSTSGKDEILIVSSEGQCIRFPEADVRPMGRATRGVRGIKLRPKDFVVGADVISEDDKGKKLLVIMEKGLGKKTKVTEYSAQTRGGIGVKTANITDKTGKIVGTTLVGDDALDLLCISKEGQVIRVPLKAVPSLGRTTQGVRIMKMKERDRVASMSVLGADEGEEEIDTKG
ncbi:MAG: DNA gyrase subunit A [Patescibacteria group bacterium]